MSDKAPTTPTIAATTAIATAVPLTQTETGLLLAAAAHGGRLTFAAGTKPATRARLLGRFLRDGLVTPPGGAGGVDDADAPHRLAAAGYRAVGRTPPKPTRKAKIGANAPAADISAVACAAPDAAVSKKAQVLALLAREEGATLAELTAATDWLPHTARAALSRIRTGGQVLVKAARPDAATAYRISAPVVPPARTRKPRRSPVMKAASTPATTRAVDTAVPAPAAA